MIDLPYKAPVKVHVFNRRWVIRDTQGREVIEIQINSNAIDYWKRMTAVSNFIQDLMNGQKSVSYNPGTKGYEIMSHAEAPAPGMVVPVPGTLAAVEQAQMEKIKLEQNGHQATIAEKVVEKVQEVVAAVRKRGRPRKVK